ncbi:MAG: Ig-like domain repeat protein [Saprospiraceae bacterium]
MKPLKFSTLQFLLVAFFILMNACKKEENITGPPPTISITGAPLSGVAGTKVTLAATINAPEGLSEFNVLKNGAAFDNIAGAGASQTVLSYSKEYTIENLPAGSIVNFTLQAVDTKNQSSILTNIPVTITAVPPKSIIVIPAGSLADGAVSWTADKIYKLSGFVRVGEESTKGTITKRTTLTIEPGTLIIGDRATKGTLIVQRGSKIVANGTASNPIIMTSERAAGTREAGDWGGLVICGQAPNNLAESDRELEGGYGGFHGGTDAADNSGSLKYLRVEFAGIPINPNQEVNSLTFGSVGSGTTVDYVQASFGLDDSYEWFGGTVNCKHLIAYKGLDDDFDTDNGFSGYVQYGVGIRGTTIADQSGSNGFECDNHATGAALTPFTSAIFANMSLIGPKGAKETSISTQFQHGAQLRRNNKQKIYNTLITGYVWGLYIDSQLGDAKGNAEKGDIDLQNVALIGIEGWGTNFWGTGGSVSYNPKGTPVRDAEANAAATPILIGGQTPTNWFKSLPGNKILDNRSTTGLSSSLWEVGKPTFVLGQGTALTSGAALPATLPAFFDKTDYIGAFKDTDWTTGWSEFNPQTSNYIK